MLYKAPRGTFDILPQDQSYRRYIKNKIGQICQLYGYQRIDTPMFEDAGLFVRSIGKETDIVSFLTNKAEQVGKFPELLKAQESLMKDLESIIEELKNNKLHLYHELIRPIESLINISNSFEQRDLTSKLTQLLNNFKRADNLAKELFSLDTKINENLANL